MDAMLFAIALSVTAPALKDKAGGNERIVGEWVVESLQSTGKFRPPPKGEQHYVFGPDGKLTVLRGERKVGGDDRGYVYDAKKTPATIDLIADTTDQESSVTCGIYRIEGDQLTLVLARRGNARPASFEIGPDAPGTRYIMKRVKAKE
jgi:uncharacterized protein (TIGR03067 family)